MKLAYRLFASHLTVVLVALLMLIGVTAYIAPLDFSERMQHSAMMGRGRERLEELEEDYRATLYQALILSGIAGVIMAVFLSWWLSQRIIHPIRLLVFGSQKIADGEYQQRLNFSNQDELGELVQSFNRMAEALANTETMRRELLADVSHELKTPLASIKAYMEALQDGILPASPESYHMIYREAARLQRLVTDLQELSRAEAKQDILNIQTLNLTLLLERLLERFSPQYKEKQILLKLDSPQESLTIHADPDRLEQVLTNILGNALQYTPGGGVVKICVRENPENVLISVADNGIGIDKTEQKLIFQRFYRVDKSRARSSGGSGIGLTIAKSLIEAQSGRIWLESPGLGKGSTFYIEIPR